MGGSSGPPFFLCRDPRYLQVGQGLFAEAVLAPLHLCHDALAGCQPACISYQNFAPPLGQPRAGAFSHLGSSMPLLVIPDPLSPNNHQVMHGEWQIGQINPALSGGTRWLWALNGVPGGDTY
jgi:hypothetical protein